MITFYTKNNLMILQYPLPGEGEYYKERLESNETIRLRKVFSFTKQDCLNIDFEDSEDHDCLDFKFAQLKEDRYWHIAKEILHTKHDVLLASELFEQKPVYLHARGVGKKVVKWFRADRDISIFGKLDSLCDEQIIIGGKHTKCIPFDTFELFIEQFPTSYELDRYADSRITQVLKDFLPSMTDGEEKLQNYFRKKAKRIKTTSSSSFDIPDGLYQHELQKYSRIKEILEEKLSSGDTLPEKNWQEFIKSFLLLIFPQYIAVLDEVCIPESYSKSHKITSRFIDLVLVNSNGCLDIIEIKCPNESYLLSRSHYRDNYFPARELSGSIMQSEKYLFYLKSLGKTGETRLTEKYEAELPDGTTVKIRNPKSFLILGRSKGLNEQQQSDLEIIKRKYSNISQILTYDDLLDNLGRVISSLTKKVSNGSE